MVHQQKPVDREGDIRARLDDLSDGEQSAAERALLARLMASFTGKTPGGIDRLADVMRQGDIDATEHQAHVLKGSADNFGVTVLAGMFAHVEDEVRAGRLPDPASTIDAIRREYSEIAPICGRITAALGEDSATMVVHEPPVGRHPHVA